MRKFLFPYDIKYPINKYVYKRKHIIDYLVEIDRYVKEYYTGANEKPFIDVLSFMQNNHLWIDSTRLGSFFVNCSYKNRFCIGYEGNPINYKEFGKKLISGEIKNEPNHKYYPLVERVIRCEVDNPDELERKEIIEFIVKCSLEHYIAKYNNFDKEFIDYVNSKKNFFALCQDNIDMIKKEYDYCRVHKYMVECELSFKDGQGVSTIYLEFHEEFKLERLDVAVKDSHSNRAIISPNAYIYDRNIYTCNHNWKFGSDTGNKVIEAKAKNGKLNGDLLIYRKDGSVAFEGKFKDDKPVGSFILYNEDGSIEKVISHYAILRELIN